MAGTEILYMGITAVAVYFAWQYGLLDQAGQMIVQATAPKQGFAKEHGRRHERRPVIIAPPEPIIEYPGIPDVKHRMRMTIA
jgi:hypothetical protein